MKERERVKVPAIPGRPEAEEQREAAGPTATRTPATVALGACPSSQGQPPTARLERVERMQPLALWIALAWYALATRRRA